MDKGVHMRRTFLLGILLGVVSILCLATTDWDDTMNFRNGVQVNSTHQVASASYTIGSESSNVINVAVQLQDGTGSDMAVRSCVEFFVSSDSNGDATDTPDTSFAIGTDGVAYEWTSDNSGMLCSESDGDIDVDIGESTAKTFHLCVVLPHGETSCSAAITFA